MTRALMFIAAGMCAIPSYAAEAIMPIEAQIIGSVDGAAYCAADDNSAFDTRQQFEEYCQKLRDNGLLPPVDTADAGALTSKDLSAIEPTGGENGLSNMPEQ